ncbi:helix-turn-helix domain-containing protein [Mycolicibacter algericus]|uniref:Helix-turn-helix domain-containing protein n=2 Tax=Mycolicibacter algericus TaxID=1288388 RepID=A0A7I9Y400_MYCAL|nr:helix-turn-helix domain-containing protein [Mycolicibacter algericus]OQZ96949.1 hypothetical protein BST10_10260 [Mycolicibacter algericus DSM 45454]GFG83354.1 hypothetical protein MALGJ_00300 [Mycolicibacter algericus]
MTAAVRVPQLLTVTETMGVLKVSRATLYRLFAAGELRWVQIGAHRRISVAEVQRFITANAKASA